jgi:hypothetical protein
VEPAGAPASRRAADASPAPAPLSPDQLCASTKADLSAAAGDYTAGWSELSDSVPVASPRARALLAAGLPRYRSLAALSAEGLDAEAEGGGCVSFQVLVPPHGAALVELPGVL